MGAGQVNLKGKKYKLMGCGCCYMFDFRDGIRKKHDMKWAADYINNMKYYK
jgi:hypothetical protein